MLRLLLESKFFPKHYTNAKKKYFKLIGLILIIGFLTELIAHAYKASALIKSQKSIEISPVSMIFQKSNLIKSFSIVSITFTISCLYLFLKKRLKKVKKERKRNMKTFKIIGIIIFLGVSIYGFKYSYDISFSGNDKIKIIENYESTSSINDIIENPKFKNKVLYIDIWGVYCKPCIKEFKILPELKEKYKNDPIEFIYLASPYNRIDDTQKWKSGIKKYNLQGYNALMSLTFYQDIWKEIPEMKNPFSIPHYLIVDKNGKVINPNAPRPSDKKDLYNELDKLL